MRVKHFIQALDPMKQPKIEQSLLTVRALISAARGNRTQEEYAAILGVRQDMLSRYESGRIANPPARVIEHCMRELHIAAQQEIPAAAELAHRVQHELSEANTGPVRAVISTLLDVLAARNRTRRARASQHPG